MKRISYPNAETVKLKNKKFTIGVLKDDYVLEWTILSEDLRPRAVHIVKRNKAVTTGIKVGKESALAMLSALYNQLKKDNLI